MDLTNQAVALGLKGQMWLGKRAACEMSRQNIMQRQRAQHDAHAIIEQLTAN